ncbi:MAG TPA: SDR family NAD(P)-dependent oxidoreductase [Steroidobacteraceae bacterium]|nr:SDR family NAD(P)-dependent oxidoreductase [Steroidobacteraceae bacterium]
MKVRELLDLSGRVALVSGGSRGLGLAMAAALAEMGARVAITARKTAELAEAQALLKQEGHEVATLVSDLSRSEAAKPLVEGVMAQLGPIDILVNNAGTSWGAPAEEYPLDAWRKVIDLNLTGTWELTRQVAASCMIPRGYGRIINIASIAALRGSTGDFKAVAYSASKGGIVSLTRALAGEWGAHGIAVNAICPGFIPSKMSRGILQSIGAAVIEATPLHQLGCDDDMKGIIVLLAGAAARHITGQVFTVDGGITAV